METRDDDAFWAARRVAAFTDELIRAAARTGQFSNPAAEKLLGDVLIKRREKIKSIYLTAVNPIVNPRLDAKPLDVRERGSRGRRRAAASVTYRASWMNFNNATGATTPLSATQSQTTTIEAPAGLPTAAGSFVAVDISLQTSRPTRPGSSRCAPTSAGMAEAGN